MEKNGKISWSSKLVDVSKIKPTPNNYKIRSDLGMERLKQSLKAFGLAGNVVCNTDLSLIDGNSRVEDEKKRNTKKIWVSIPSRKLSPTEYKEMAAMFDVAKAGEVDMDRINSDLGTTLKFFDKWNIEKPMELLAKLGSKMETDSLEYPEKTKGKSKEEVRAADIKMIQAFFSTKEEKQFRDMEQVLRKRLKVDNTTQVIFKSIVYTFKNLK